jgi:hypothetical protein
LRRLTLTSYKGLPAKDALGAIKTPEGLQALCEETCKALGIEPQKDDADGQQSSGNKVPLATLANA